MGKIAKASRCASPTSWPSTRYQRASRYRIPHRRSGVRHTALHQYDTLHHVVFGHDVSSGMSFWPTQDHWSVQIPARPAPAPAGPPRHWLRRPHRRRLRGSFRRVAGARVHGLEERRRRQLRPVGVGRRRLDCRGFWDKGKTDKNTLWTSNAAISPTLKTYVDGTGANFGRVQGDQARTAKAPEEAVALAPPRRQQSVQPGRRGMGGALLAGAHRQPRAAGYMLLMDNGPDGLPDPATELRVPLHTAHGSWSTRSGCGTWSCTPEMRPATRSSPASSPARPSNAGSIELPGPCHPLSSHAASQCGGGRRRGRRRRP